jgi:hypothetical protein
MDFISEPVATLILSAISMIAALGSAFYAGGSINTAKAANKTAEQALQYQVLIPMLVEYKSAEMLMAVRTLWAFARKNPGRVKEAFTIQRDEEYNALQLLPLADQVNQLRATIDYQRRIVSQFYGILISILDQGSLQKAFVYSHWGKSDLSIITEVLIPMELAATHVASLVDSPSLTRLKKFYDNCPASTQVVTT